MKTALVLHGNLRTFFMNMREYNDFRICDLLMQNIVEPNDPDIFISTDTYDFFYQDAQYYCLNQINVTNNNGMRLYHKINFISSDEARDIINRELTSFFGNRIKGMTIKDYDDLENDPKYQLLKNDTGKGASPAQLVGQYKKILNCYELLENFEKNNNIKYDIIIKCRFDIGFNKDEKLIVSNYDYHNNDVYVPRKCGPKIDDWYAFGNRKAMIPYLKLYNELGFTLADPTLIIECRYDAYLNYIGTAPEQYKLLPCKLCNRNDRLEMSDMTLTSERHISALFEKLDIKASNANYFAYVYRYRDLSQDKPVEDVIKNELRLKDVTVFNHTPCSPISIEKF